MSAQNEDAPVSLRVLSEIQRAHDRTLDEYNALAAQERAEMVARYLAARDALEAAQAAQAADADTPADDGGA